MKLQFTELQNGGGGPEFQSSKLLFESTSFHKKCQSLRFPSVIYIIFYIYIYFQFLIDFLFEIYHKKIFLI